jgi:DNA polymerase III subunit delta'
MTADMWTIAGQERAAEVLARAAAADEVGHAWAFLGPAGVGQEAASRALAAALNCQVGPDGVPCGACDVCTRCARGAYAALSEFAPTGAMHRVEEVRDQWLRTAFRTPLEGTWKVLRILEADRLNEAAVNAFLKGLEEPPPRTVWILEIADPDELPDTILSRCRALRFRPWDLPRLEAEARHLGLHDPGEAALAARACMGSPAALRRLAAPGGLDDLRAHRAIPSRLREEGQGVALLAARALDEEIKRRTAALKAAGEAELAALGDDYGGKPPPAVTKQLEDRNRRREREVRVATLQAALDDLVGWYRDCLLLAAGGDAAAAIHADAPDQLRADAEALGPARILAAVDRCFATREDLELNLQQTLALEALFLDLAAAAMAPAR